MINGEADLNLLIYDALKGISTNTAPTGQPEVLEAVPIRSTMPEEAVEPRASYPSITLFYIDDVSLEGKPLRQQGEVYAPVDPQDLSKGYEVRDHPTIRRFVYQIDVYTRNYQDMLYLGQQLFSRLKREFGSLTDADGAFIPYRLTDVADLGRKIENERFYRRAFTYSFDAWVWPDRTPKRTVGPVEQITTDVHDMADEALLTTVRVPDEPPAEEEP